MASKELPECLSNRNKALNELVKDLFACQEKASNASSSISKHASSSILSKNKHAKQDVPICKELVEVPSLEKKGGNVSTSSLKSKDRPTCKDNTTSTSLIYDFWSVMSNDESDFKMPEMSTVCLKACTDPVCSGKGKKPKSPTPSEERFQSCIQLTNQEAKKCPGCSQPTNQEANKCPICSPPTNQEANKCPICSPPTNQEANKCPICSPPTNQEAKTCPNCSQPTNQEQKKCLNFNILTNQQPKKCQNCSSPIKREPKKHNCGIGLKPTVPLRKALSNLKNAAYYEKNCAERVSDLLTTQQNLTEQIQNLENKEKEGATLLKKADDMWSCMEGQYKKQLDEKKETYQKLLKEKQEIDNNLQTWRKTLKDFEFQLKTADNTRQEINLKTIQKANDVKVLKMQNESFKKRIATNAKELETTKKSYTSKKEASKARLDKITEEMQKYQQKVTDECKCKENKENEGNAYVKEAREDLQKICKCLLQKKLENEDLRAETEALKQEIQLLKTTSNTCSERCARREQNIIDETNRIDKEISEMKAKCIKCHKSTDDAELTGYCIDCPKCVTKRDCLIKGEECFTDQTKVCVCQRVKDIFLDNVFENMYSVLEKQAKTCPGKEVAECVSACLERSKNGKLDENTRKILQEFILSTVKQNLNLTIVGGAVKTRCEMDKDMYKQLMLCLKDVTVTKPVQPVKVDKAIVPKKPPCSRWNVTSECNCPRGPKNCPCVKKAPKPPAEPGSCGVVPEDDEMEDSDKWEPCAGATCPSCVYSTKMRAAQCILGNEALSNVRPHSKYHPTPPIVPCGTFKSKKATRVTGNNAVKSRYTETEQTKQDLTKVALIHYQMIAKENTQLKSTVSGTPQGPRLSDVAPIVDNLELASKYKKKWSNHHFSKKTLTPSGKIACGKTVELSVSDPQLLLSIKTTSSRIYFDAKSVIDIHGKRTQSDMSYNVISSKSIKFRNKYEEYIESGNPNDKQAIFDEVSCSAASVRSEHIPRILVSVPKAVATISHESHDSVNGPPTSGVLYDLTDRLVKKLNAATSISIDFRDKSEECIESGTSIHVDRNDFFIESMEGRIVEDEMDPIFTKILYHKNENALQCLWSKTASQEVDEEQHTVDFGYNDDEGNPLISSLYPKIITGEEREYQSGHTVQLMKPVHKTITTRSQVEPDDCCNGPSTSVCGRLVIDVTGGSDRNEESTEDIDRPVWDALSYLPLQLPHFLR